MDIGFSRHQLKRRITPLDQLNYVSLLAELAAAQTQSATARAQLEISQLGSDAEAHGPDSPKTRSFHAPTAALLRNAKDS